MTTNIVLQIEWSFQQPAVLGVFRTPKTHQNPLRTSNKSPLVGTCPPVGHQTFESVRVRALRVPRPEEVVVQEALVACLRV